MSDKYSGLEAALRSARMTFVSEANAGDRTGTEIIACEDLLPAWTKAGPKGDGSHEVGEACTHNGQSWRCCQAHNTNNNPDIEPGNSPAQWAPYHTTDPTKAKAFIQPRVPMTPTRRASAACGLMQGLPLYHGWGQRIQPRGIPAGLGGSDRRRRTRHDPGARHRAGTGTRA